MPETRILLVRDCDSPELGDNAKVAVSVLQDDGWQASLVNITGSVHLTCVPFVHDDSLAKREEKLAADLERLNKLALEAEGNSRRALVEMATVGIVVLAHWGYNLLHSREITADLLVVIALAALGGWHRNQRKAGR